MGEEPPDTTASSSTLEKGGSTKTAAHVQTGTKTLRVPKNVSLKDLGFRLQPPRESGPILLELQI